MIFKPTFKVRNRRYLFYTVKFDEDGLIDIFNCDIELFYKLHLISYYKRECKSRYYILYRLCFHRREKDNVNTNYFKSFFR